MAFQPVFCKPQSSLPKVTRGVALYPQWQPGQHGLSYDAVTHCNPITNGLLIQLCLFLAYVSRPLKVHRRSAPHTHCKAQTLTPCGCNRRNKKASAVTTGEENAQRTHILCSVFAYGVTQSILLTIHWPGLVTCLKWRQLGTMGGITGEQ